MFGISIMLSSSVSLVISICALTAGYRVSAELNYNVHLFYYPWYGAPPTSQTYVHWQGGSPGVIEHDPTKGDITSNYWPVLGPYDSCDPKALAQHMEWIASTGAGTIISSWWGKGGFEDHCVTVIMDAANVKQIKVGFHIEPYGGRTAESVASDVLYLNDKYGSHAAFYRDVAHGNRSAIYIFDSLAITDWSAVEPLKDKNILMAQTGDQSKYPHFSGFYTYAVGDDAKVVDGWKSMNGFCKQKGLIWSPSIGPGYIDRVAVPSSKAMIFDRKNGTMYDENWNFVFDSGMPNWVSITSFNEWHEGSMIEPTSSTPPSGPHPYMTYEGAYGKAGKAAETSYLERTTYWVNEFTKRQQQLN
jgi:glycoprotein endo-alpha-1,2-mannosidase